MSLTLWEPLRRLNELSDSNDFDRIIDDLFGARLPTPAERTWKPTADLIADKDAYLFRFDLPGVAKEDIDVDVADGVLTVHGKRETRSEDKDEEGHVIRRESFSGSFRRAFRLPDDIDTASVTADHRDGVLEVRVPKSPAAKARRIEVGAD